MAAASVLSCLQVKMQLQLQQQLFAVDPCQLFGLMCLAMEAGTEIAEVVVAAVVNRQNLFMAEGAVDPQRHAQQALQQQLAGQQLVMLQQLLQAATTQNQHAVLRLLLRPPAAHCLQKIKK
jgi:hypothetical protein